MLAIANPQFTLDIDRAKRSVKELLNYDMDIMICYLMFNLPSHHMMR